ncbi:N-acetylmuramoyl-L-alanine amidase [Crocinitomicaceae bacterium CZZ-1]|uniref:N-acetylmuramoyl-L-alanine amidase n=1 Tax=Taishania pollutisoli TaxID=2766479 RepID=A0A8J6P666_9FLAO|nr:N-acetylmuramoyl-L-alanine amidase [Taishania pollutisoli]MBC9812602.1 N-acetylmuramoyl-L-alanine amidase [Taishania pollutisoli]MBX2949238.1 N-acetylmuramoyl-L-alanine amidase [Crocinitomicaceae bacterium]
MLILVATGILTIDSHAQKDELFNSAIKTVVIDAGHGGKDPGCNGAHSNEKTVCLNMALALGEMIKKNYPEIKVVYTRDKDVFVELDERAKIANRNNADLFICIHANSAGPAAYGAETYVLGLHRTESQQKIAERENSTIYLEDDGGEKYKGFDLSPDAIIARQLQLSIFLDQSINYASKVQAEFKTLGRHDRGVKQAGFLVLYKTTMPSVLIETGFLTNPQEENFLGNKENQKKMAEAMFSAFRKYKNELEGVHVDTKTPITNSSQNSGTTTQQTTETTTEDEKENNNKVVFRIQIQTSQKRIPTSSKEFKGMPIYEYQQDGLYKYATGYFVSDFKSANNHKNELRNTGFEHAFVIAFLNGERINLEKAIKLAEN